MVPALKKKSTQGGKTFNILWGGNREPQRTAKGKARGQGDTEGATLQSTSSTTRAGTPLAARPSHRSELSSGECEQKSDSGLTCLRGKSRPGLPCSSPHIGCKPQRVSC